MLDGPGDLIAGQYRLIERIGRGGFAEVWHARDERLHRDVAAKRLHLLPHFTEEQRAERRERTLREARSAARLAHPGVVTVYDVVTDHGTPWIIMEFVRGRSLAELVRTDGPLPPDRVAEIGLELLGALRAAHKAGVLHRDVKPANVLLGAGRVVLGDFGLATVEGDPALTQSGIVMGAPAFTAPERARGEPAVAASDLWSLGATLFYAVEGRRPFEGTNPNAVFHAILTREPAPTRRAGPLAPALERLLCKDPAARPSTAEAAGLLSGAITAARGNAPASRPGARHRGRGHVPPATTRRTAAILTAAGAAAVALTLTAVPEHPGDIATRPRPAPGPPHPIPRLVATLPGGSGRISTVTFSPDGRTLAAGGTDHTVRLWHVAGHRPAGTLPGQPYEVLAAAFSPGGRLLATGGNGGTVVLWNTREHRRVATLDTHGRSVDALTFSPDGAVLASAGDVVRLWDVPHRRPAGSLPAEGGGMVTAVFAPRGRVLATAGTWTVRLWDAARPVRPVRPATVTRLTALVAGMAFSADGRTLATGGYDGRVRLWDVASRRLVATLPALPARVGGVAFSPDGRRLACAGGDRVLLWDVPGGRAEAVLPDPAAPVDAVAFTPDGRTLATGGHDAVVRLWHLDPSPPG